MKKFLGVLALLSLLIACPLAAQSPGEGDDWLDAAQAVWKSVTSFLVEVLASDDELASDDAEPLDCGQDCDEMGGGLDPDG